MSKPSYTNPLLFVGKPVTDEYERQIGRATLFVVNTNGGVGTVFVERLDGSFSRYSSDRFEVNEKGITLSSAIKLKVKGFCGEIPLIWRKNKALTELLEKKKISAEIFKAFNTKFENKLNQLKADGKTALENINKEVSRCVQQIKEIELAKIHLEIEHEIGKIDEKIYEVATKSIEKNLEKFRTEKRDLEDLRNNLSNILLDESTEITEKKMTEKKVISTPSKAPKLPEPPVTVNVSRVTS